MDALTANGAAAVTLMLVFYALEGRSHFYVLAFAVACLARPSMAAFKARGPSAWSSWCGQESPCAGGNIDGAGISWDTRRLADPQP